MIQEKSEGEKKPLGENHLAVYKLEKDYFFLAGRPLRFAGAFALAAVFFFAVLAFAFFFLAGAFLALVTGVFTFFTFFFATLATFFTAFFATLAFLTVLVLRFFAGILFLPKKFSLKIQHIYFTMKIRKIKLFDHVFIVFCIFNCFFE